MYTKLVFFAILASSCFARPQNEISQPVYGQKNFVQKQNYLNPTQNATIISKTEELNEDGTFSFSFETSDGIRVQQNGFQKKADKITLENADEDGQIQVIMGGYSYTAPNGEVIQVQYIADENGFQPQGSHIGTGAKIQNNNNKIDFKPRTIQQPLVNAPQIVARSLPEPKIIEAPAGSEEVTVQEKTESSEEQS